MKRVRSAVLPAALAAALLAVLGVAGPAHATTTAHGCTVMPQRPVFAGTFTPQGLPEVSYGIIVICQLGLTIDVEQTRKEQDTQAREGDTVDDTTGVTTYPFDFTVIPGPQATTGTHGLVLTGPANEGQTEEVYQSVRFRVHSGPVTSPWTAAELTQPATIFR